MIGYDLISDQLNSLTSENLLLQDCCWNEVRSYKDDQIDPIKASHLDMGWAGTYFGWKMLVVFLCVSHIYPWWYNVKRYIFGGAIVSICGHFQYGGLTVSESSLPEKRSRIYQYPSNLVGHLSNWGGAHHWDQLNTPLWGKWKYACDLE